MLNMKRGNYEYFNFILLLIFANTLIDGDLSTNEKIEIRDLHNKFRADVNPPASKMPGLTWTDQLGDRAQVYAENCDLKDPSVNDTLYSDFGVNTGFFEAATEERDFERIIESWNNQNSSYNYLFNSCDIGRNCTDYKQLVNDASSRVGCGFAACGSSNTINNYLVCFYLGKPNIALRPYVEGAFCSQCQNFVCYNNLCYDEGFTSTTSKTSSTTSTTSTTTTTTPIPSSTTTETTVTPSTPTPTTTGTPCTTSWKPHFPCLYDCFKSYAVTAEYSLLSCSLLVLTSISFKIFYE